MTKKKVIHPLDPIFDKDCEILLLGSIPSVKSREENFYYAHPKNRFWKVLSKVYESNHPINNEEKIEFLLNHHIAIWDVIHSCNIKNSSDASITNVKVNNIKKLIKSTKIKRIFTLGKTAKKYYDKYCLSNTKIEAISLPSTSPANATYSLEKLVIEYKKALKK